MEKNNHNRSLLECSKNTVSGYTIEIGSTTYENTLEERIQAAKNASSSAKISKKQNFEEKYSNSRNFKDINVKKSLNNAQEVKIKNKPMVSINKSDIQTHTSLNLTKTINDYSNIEFKCNTNLLRPPTYKGGGLMQRRLEAIKSNKKVSNKISTEYNNTLESKNVSLQDIPHVKNHCYNLYNTNISKRNEYSTRSTVQKHPCEVIKYNGHCDRTKDTCIPYKSVSSVQNRLITAREKMTAKSKDNDEINVSKIGKIKKKPTCALGNIHQDTNTLSHNFKNKTKRLNDQSPNVKKRNLSLVSTTKKIILNKNSSVSNLIDQQLMKVQQKPVVNRYLDRYISPNLISSSSSSVSETIVSTKLENQYISKNSKCKELESFSFVMPQTSCNQQTLDIKKNSQIDDDESMEWEDIIEPINIVEKVNDLRRTKHEYEPMEWSPDSILHCDRINYCLVIDTNVLLSDLNSLTIVIDTFLPDYGYPTIVLPWQVFKELDCMKKSENALGYRAREAARWLLEMLLKRHPRLKGQPMTRKSNMVPDDDILECAITVKGKVNIVYLVTDDKILSIKSEVNGIPAKNSSWLQSLVSNKNQTQSKIFQEAVKNYPIIENKLIMNFEPRLEHIISRVLKCAVSLSKNHSIHAQKSWWKIYSLTQPFNLSKCLIALKKHWNIVAPQQSLLKAPVTQLDSMEYFFNDLEQISPEISLSWIELYNFLKYSTETFIALPYEYYHITDIILNDLMKARRILRQKLDGTVVEEESFNTFCNLSLSNSYTNNIDNILQNISKTVDIFCSYVYNFNGFKRDVSKNEQNCGIIIEKINVNERINDFSCKLSNIIKVMLKIKSLNSEQLLESHITIDAFLKAIIEFNTDCMNLSKENIVDYCLMKNKNSFFHVLISFQNNLAAMKNLITIIKS